MRPVLAVLLLSLVVPACTRRQAPGAGRSPAAATALSPAPDPATCTARMARAADPASPDPAAATRVEGLFPACAAVLEAPLGGLIGEWLARSVDPEDKARMAATDRLYRLYLRTYPSRATVQRHRLLHAELSWRIRLAADAEARAETDSLPVEHRRQAAHARVMALLDSLRADVTAAPARPPPDRGPGQITDDDRRLLDACLDYLRVSDGGDGESTRIRYHAGRAYWTSGYFELAVPLFERIVADQPDSEVAEYSASLLLDTLNRLERHDRMQAWVRRLLQDARFTGLRGRLENLVPLSIQLDRHAADALERQGDHAGCGHAHAALAAAHPGHERADEALYNAALCFERASLMREATQSAEELVRRFPRSALRERARELIGRLQGVP